MRGEYDVGCRGLIMPFLKFLKLLLYSGPDPVKLQERAGDHLGVHHAFSTELFA